MRILTLIALAASLVGCADAAFAQVRITEFMYSGSDGEFVEITNTGPNAVDLSGWSFDDDSNVPGSFPIGALGTLASGESAIITDVAASAFRTAWGRCAAAKIIGANGHNLGRNDVIHLYDAGGASVDTLRFGDQTFPGTIRTQNVAGWVSAAGLGADAIAQWTLASLNDAEGSSASALGDIGSPGVSTRSAQPYDPCASIGPRLRITEYLYDSLDGEFVEFTNVGDAAADLTGWSFDDDSNAAGTVSLSAFGTVQPGEAVLLTDHTAAAFRSAWGLCSGVRIVGGNGAGLGRADQINLYDAAGQRVDRLTYDDQTIAGSVRAKDKSAWVSAAGLGADQALQWTLSALGDAEQSRASAAGAIGSPGKSQRALFDFDPCAGSAGAPVVTVDIAQTTRRLDLAVNGGGAVAATLADATDPAAVDGIVFALADDGGVAALTVTATSSDAAIVAAGGLALSGSGATRTLRITPAGVGYATITVRATDAGGVSGSYAIAYAASVGGAAQLAYTGAADASAAVASGDHVLVADDEGQRLRLFPRDRSGLAENGFDFTASLALTDIDGGVPREVDLEGAARDGDLIFWTGSHSNKKDNGAARPNRQRVFATRIAGSGAATTLSYVGRYDHLRTDLVAWDDANGHGLGAGALGLAASAAIGVWPERDDGFNIEGVALAPDADGLYVAFRAPLLPLAQRHDALVIHATNLRSVVATAPAGASAAAGSLSFAAPIRLDLGGRGIRDIARTADGRYLIAAGPTAVATGVAPANFRLYLWSGGMADAPQLLDVDLSVLAAAGSLETLVNADAANGGGLMLELLTDSGDTVWYRDGIVAKDLPEPRHRKFVGGRVALDLAPVDRLFADGFD